MKVLATDRLPIFWNVVLHELELKIDGITKLQSVLLSHCNNDAKTEKCFFNCIKNEWE